MRACLLFTLLFLLAACAPQPTALLPTATSTPAPTHTPTLTPSPTLTPTPTPLPHPAAFDEAFARRLIRYDAASGQWLVSVVQTADGGRQTADFILLPDSFATHDDLRAHNPLAPYTVRAISPLPAGEGPGVREVTLLWDAEKAEFRLAYTFPPLFEGVGTENPRLIEENLDQIPFIPIEDIQSGLAAQSVLLAMQEDGYQPFTEESAQNFGAGYLLRFTMPDNNLKLADLLSYNDQSPNTDTFQELIIKTSPYWIRTKIGDQIRDVVALTFLNPQDAKNPKPDEFLVVFGIPHAGDIITLSSFPTYNPEDFYRLKNPAFASQIHLYAQRADGTPLDPNSPNLVESLLSQLLSIEGNDASDLGQNTGYVNIQVNIDNGMKHLPELKIIETQPFSRPFPPQLQQMIFLFEVGVAK